MSSEPIDDLLRQFQRACEDVVVRGDSNTTKARAILRNDLRARLLARAASSTEMGERDAEIVKLLRTFGHPLPRVEAAMREAADRITARSPIPAGHPGEQSAKADGLSEEERSIVRGCRTSVRNWTTVDVTTLRLLLGVVDRLTGEESTV